MFHLFMEFLDCLNPFLIAINPDMSCFVSIQMYGILASYWNDRTKNMFYSFKIFENKYDKI